MSIFQRTSAMFFVVVIEGPPNVSKLFPRKLSNVRDALTMATEAVKLGAQRVEVSGPGVKRYLTPASI